MAKKLNIYSYNRLKVNTLKVDMPRFMSLVDFADIDMIRSYGDGVFVYINDNKNLGLCDFYIKNIKIQDVLYRLPNMMSFASITNNIIVNLDYIVDINKNFVKLRDRVIPVKKSLIENDVENLKSLVKESRI